MATGRAAAEAHVRQADVRRTDGPDGADERTRVVLTAHPLQRVGAYALAMLGRAVRPEALTPERFERAVKTIVSDATAAALTRDTKSKRGFWLKCSHSFFPNSKMNHPGNGRKSDEVVREAVADWLSTPRTTTAPGAACVLCGRAAIGFYGKKDVPLAESDLYRNTTPRGHAGMALCRPCLWCFRALPYGCRQTGGPAIALHSWDERFMARTLSRQVERNRQLIAFGAAEPGGIADLPEVSMSRGETGAVEPREIADQEVLASREAVAQGGTAGRRKAGAAERGGIADREVLALWALRGYADRLTAGVELLLFSNANQGQRLEAQSMDQPMAEWLRRTARPPRGKAFRALLRAHATRGRPGVVGLARNAFVAPERIAGACRRYLAADLGRGVVRPEMGDLAELCLSFLIEVMRMNQSEIDEINAVGRKVAAWLYAENSAGKLRAFNATLKNPRAMRTWLRGRDLDGLLDRDRAAEGPLITEHQYRLLFDPEVESAWLHREVLVVSVVQRLHELGFTPADGAEVATEIREEEMDHPEDRAILRDDDDDDDLHDDDEE